MGLTKFFDDELDFMRDLYVSKEGREILQSGTGALRRLADFISDKFISKFDAPRPAENDEDFNARMFYARRANRKDPVRISAETMDTFLERMGEDRRVVRAVSFLVVNDQVN